MSHAILVAGAPATGKTTVGRLVAGALRAALVDQDVVTGPLVAAIARGVDLDGPRGTALRAARYESVLATAEDCLSVGTSAVLVAPFTAERSDPDAFGVVAERFAAVGASTTMVWLTAPVDVLVARLTERGAGRDAGKLADPDAYFRAGSLAAPVVPHVRIDATQDPRALLDTILASLP